MVWIERGRSFYEDVPNVGHHHDIMPQTRYQQRTKKGQWGVATFILESLYRPPIK